MRIIKRIASMPQQFWGMLVKEYMLQFRRKKYLYLSLFLPLLVGLVYALMLTDTNTSTKVIICDQDKTQVTSELYLLPGFTITQAETQDCDMDVIQAVRKREYLFGITIPRGFTSRLENLQTAHIVVHYDNSNPSIANLALWRVDVALLPFKQEIVNQLSIDIQEKSSTARQNADIALALTENLRIESIRQPIREARDDLIRLENIEPEFITQPVATRLSGVHPWYELIDIGMPPLFAVLALFMLLMLCSTSIIHDQKIKFITRIRVSSTTMISYLLAKIVFFTGVLAIQFLVILMLFFLFGARFDIDIGLLMHALLFIALVNIMIGIIIGLISDSEGVAVLMSLIITLPLLFLSGMFYPLDIMPTTIQFLAAIMPLETQIELLKGALLFGGEINGKLYLIPAGMMALALFLIRKVR